MSEIKITLPWFDSALMPNNKNGKSWKSVREVKDAYKQICNILAKQSNISLPEGNIPLTIIFHQPDNRRDLDNCLAAIKSGLDGVADGLGVNDKRFRPITIDFGKADKKNPRVEIIIKNIEPAVFPLD